MQKNLILAIVISTAFIILWDAFVLGPRLKKAPLTLAPAPSGPARSKEFSAPEPKAPQPPIPSKTYLLQTERARVQILSTGGAIKHWHIQESGQWVDMVMNPEGAELPLQTFPELEFSPEADFVQGSREIRLSAIHPQGFRLTKHLKLDDSQLHTLEFEVTSLSKEPRQVDLSLMWGPGLGTVEAEQRENAHSLRSIALGPLKVRVLKGGEYTGSYRWAGVDNRYYLAAFLPREGAFSRVSGERPKGGFPSTVVPLSLSLAPGGGEKFSWFLYLGPKGYTRLKRFGLGLEEAVDFGLFGFLGKALLHGLEWFKKITGNYGWAIVLVTVILQLLTMPLNIRSLKHSLRMKELQPQMKRIQELYKGDQKRLHVEMMNLYKRHGLKFMGLEGCFPMLLQLPFFWAFYTTLRNAYELRQAPWIFWIKDLSAADPYRVLPILMGAGMFFQQRMTTSTADPTQAKMMWIMPIIFVFMFMGLPSGLVLYWFVNSLLTLVLQSFLLSKHKKTPSPAV